jgi:cytochrome c peroxidase
MLESMKLSIICGAVLGISIACSIALAQVSGPIITNAVAGPLPPPVMPPNEIKLTPVEQLGKFMLYDHTLSNPPGYACATCHVPEAGFTGPDSSVNLFGGPQPGVVPGRFSNRKPQSYVYAVFCPVGPVFRASLGVYIGGDFWDGRVPDLSGQAKQPPINPNEMANTPVDPIRPLREVTHRCSPRSSRTAPILPSSGRCMARTPSRNIPPSRSTISSLWRPLRTSPRER